MPSSQYLHPEFGYLGATSRWRHDLKVAVVSALFGAIASAGSLAVLIADRDSKTDGPSTSARVEASAAQPASDPGPIAQPTPHASRAPLPTTETTPSPMDGANAARPETDGKSNTGKPDASGAAGSKAACDDSTWSQLDGKCVPQDKSRKQRLRAANDAPAIGRAPVGRSAAPSAPAASGSDEPPQGPASPPGAAQAKPADAAAPAEPPAPAAAPAKKPQKTARSHSRPRDQDWIELPSSWSEVREEDEWSVRGYARYPNERYGRGGDRYEGRYIRDGFWGWSR
jgi:hypothetical protein